MSTRTVGIVLPFPAKPASDLEAASITAPRTDRFMLKEGERPLGAFRGLVFTIVIQAVLAALFGAGWIAIRLLR